MDSKRLEGLLTGKVSLPLTQQLGLPETPVSSSMQWVGVLRCWGSLLQQTQGASHTAASAWGSCQEASRCFAIATKLAHTAGRGEFAPSKTSRLVLGCAMCACVHVPQVVCPGGCGEEYCSEPCRQQAWQQHHCLLCPGPAQDRSSSG